MPNVIQMTGSHAATRDQRVFTGFYASLRREGRYVNSRDGRCKPDLWCRFRVLGHCRLFLFLPRNFSSEAGRCHTRGFPVFDFYFHGYPSITRQVMCIIM